MRIRKKADGRDEREGEVGWKYRGWRGKVEKDIKPGEMKKICRGHQIFENIFNKP